MHQEQSCLSISCPHIVYNRLCVSEAGQTTTEVLVRSMGDLYSGNQCSYGVISVIPWFYSVSELEVKGFIC
jgi:hypothetical protein